MSQLRLRTFQIGAESKRGEGLRIAVTRWPPRGVPREHWQKDGWFDVWLPVVAPSQTLIRWARRRDFDDKIVQQTFFYRYEREMLGHTVSLHTIELLASTALRTPISIGCFCADESRCHRSVLHRLIEQAASGR
jgi:uncharacterized protein YeaO (DUF488 family)